MYNERKEDDGCSFISQLLTSASFEILWGTSTFEILEYLLRLEIVNNRFLNARRRRRRRRRRIASIFGILSVYTNSVWTTPP